jgi:hypothetical protein
MDLLTALFGRRSTIIRGLLFGAQTRPITHVVVGLARRDTRTQWQDRGRSLQSLHAAFFVDAQNDRVHRRIHVKPDDVTQLLHKIRISAELEVLDPMRLQIVSTPCALNRAVAHLMTLGQFARTPVRRVLRSRVQG